MMENLTIRLPTSSQTGGAFQVHLMHEHSEKLTVVLISGKARGRLSK